MPVSRLLADWSSRELTELQAELALQHYESLGLELIDREGEMKSFETLKLEEIAKDLERRAEAGLKGVKR